ncbi:MAG: ABC transporter permease [Candidatus Bipolaricaulota bacterium]
MLGLVAAMVMLWAGGYDAGAVLGGSLSQALFTQRGVMSTLGAATPLLLTAITWAVGIRSGVFNIGAEGTLMVAAAATIAAGGLLRLPPGIHHLIALLAAIAAGVLWNVPIAYAKVKRNVHEVVSTIMANWIALYLTGFLVVWLLRDPAGVWSVSMAPTARFQALVRGTTLTGVLFIAIAVALVAYVLLWHTKTGQHIRATGFGWDVARNCGIRVERALTLGFLIGGGAAGVAGYALTAGLPPTWAISDKLGALMGYGFTGIAVAAVGGNHPLGVIVAAMLIGALTTAGRFMQMFFGVPPEITEVVVGMIVLLLALPAFSGALRRHMERKARGSS